MHDVDKQITQSLQQNHGFYTSSIVTKLRVKLISLKWLIMSILTNMKYIYIMINTNCVFGQIKHKCWTHDEYNTYVKF